MKAIEPIVIILDFDGTVVKHEFPKVGKDIGAVPVLKRCIDAGHKLVLFTMRDNYSDEVPTILIGDHLKDAVKWFEENGIPLYGVQTNPDQKAWTKSPKAYGQLIIDDAALGCPLTGDGDGERSYVDWESVEIMLENRGYLPRQVTFKR